MDATTTLAIGIPVLALCVMAVIFLLIAVRRQQTQIKDTRWPGKEPTSNPDEPYDPAPAVAPLPGGDEVVRSLSTRIAALEGRIPQLAGQLESFTALSTRLAALEASMPSIQEAYEHYSDAINRADKRDTERARRVTKTTERKSAAQAVSELMPEIPAPVEAPTNGVPQKRAGVLGQGTRGRS